MRSPIIKTAKKIIRNQRNFLKNLKNNLKKKNKPPISPKIIAHKNEVFWTNTKPEPGSI